jgi:hypothetical protein
LFFCFFCFLGFVFWATAVRTQDESQASKQTWLTRRRDKAEEYADKAEQLRVDVVVVFVGRKSAHVLDASLVARDHVEQTAYRVIIIIIFIQRARLLNMILVAR